MRFTGVPKSDGYVFFVFPSGRMNRKLGKRTSSSVNCDHLTRSRNSFKTRAERAGIKAGRAANVCFSSSLLECRALNVAWDG